MNKTKQNKNLKTINMLKLTDIVTLAKPQCVRMPKLMLVLHLSFSEVMQLCWQESISSWHASRGFDSMAPVD